MPVIPANLFADPNPPETGERFETLLAREGVHIERIVSSAAIVPERQVQAHDEWVALLAGLATLEIDGRPVELRAGDTLFIAAGVPHTVQRTSQGAIWLAVHLPPREADAV